MNRGSAASGASRASTLAPLRSMARISKARSRLRSPRLLAIAQTDADERHLERRHVRLERFWPPTRPAPARASAVRPAHASA